MGWRNGEADIVQNQPFRIIAEAHVLKADLSAVDIENPGVWLIGDLRRLVQQCEHVLHVHQRLPDLTVHGAEKIQRNRQLHQISVDDDKSANGHRPVPDVECSHD